MNRLARAAARIEAGIEALGVVILVVMLAVTAYQVFARYVLEAPTFWSEELARFLMAWLTMLGSAVLIRSDGHIAVDYFVNRLPPAGKHAARFLCDLLTLATCGLLAYYGAQLVSLGGRTTSSGLGLQMAYPYLAIPLGAILIALIILLTRIASAGTQVESAGAALEVKHGR